jgi:uncharacterized protein (TIGR03437 family)
VTPDAAQSCGFANIAWGFVARIDPGGPQGLRYASLLRGSGQDSAQSAAIGPDGRAWVAGYTNSDDFEQLSPTVAQFHEAGARTFVAAVDPDRPAGPVVGCLAHAGDLLPTEIAPGEIVSLFGMNLGPETAAAYRLDPAGRVATQLAGVRVLFDGIPAPLLYVSSRQINMIVPASVRGRKRVMVRVQSGAGASQMFPAYVADSAPGFFTLDGSGTGAAAALNQDGTVNSPANPARRGEVITLFGTGGLWDPGAQDGQINPLAARPLSMDFEVWGLSPSRPAEVLFSGPAPGQVAGVFQLNIRIPADAWTGDRIPISTLPRNRTPFGHEQTIAIRE